jgi:CheY-like chemotaxis protein
MKVKVLVVDDDQDIRSLVRMILESKGMEVDEAATGEEALHKLRGGDDKPDLILLDVMMPGMNGWEVLRELKRDTELQSIPVVMLSAIDPTVEDMMRPEFDELVDYVLKPDLTPGLLGKFKNKLTPLAGGP